MKKLLALSLLFIAYNLHAADFSYNNVSVSYSKVDVEIIPGLSIKGNGFDLEGNFALNKTFYIPARYQSISFDFGIDSSMYLVGLGAHMPLSPTMDLYGSIQAGNYSMDIPPKFDDNAMALTVGLRTAIASNMEATFYATTVSMDTNFNDQSGIGAKLNYAINKNTAIIGRAEFLSDITTLSVGAQFNF